MALDKTREVFDREIKRKRDLGLLRHAAAFPRVLSKWSDSQKKFFSLGGIAQTKNASLEKLASSPFALRWCEHTFGPYAHLGLSVSVELARVVVPAGNIGILKRLNQVVSGWALADWGQPWTANATIDAIQWRLQLTRADDLGGRWINASPVLPGEPFSDLPLINGLWYLPQAAQADLNANIRGGAALRFFAILPVTQVEITIGGRLCAVQQAEYSSAAAQNVSRSS